MNKKLLPSERWSKLKESIIEEIGRIDEDTRWQPSEPEWWMEMIDIQRKLSKTGEYLEKPQLRKMEVIEKTDWEENKAKLTVAVNRLSIKISSKTSKEMKKRQVAFAIWISDNVIVVNSLRGSICLDPNSKLRVTLYKRTKGRIKAHSFNEK